MSARRTSQGLVRRALLAACAAWALGCGERATTGREVVLRTRASSEPAVGSAFTTETGWTITLSKAVLSVGALYYFDGAPAFVRRDDFWHDLRQLFGAPVAYAHPGHYLAGDALGQMLIPAELSLDVGAQALGDGVGITGTVRSARVVLTPAKTPEQLPTGVVALAEGVAQQGETTVHFHLEATAGEVDGHATAGQIDGCIFDEHDIAQDGTVTMTVFPQVWFDLVDFHGVEAGSERSPTALPSDDTARIAFVLGVVQLRAYRFAYATGQ